MAHFGQRRRLSDFVGHWALDRDIFHRDGSVARFAGEAEWVADSDRLLYRETGSLVIKGQPAMVAERRYVWGPGLVVSFEDGRVFHKVPPLGGATAHWCDPDQYDGEYDFTSWPRFSVSWDVSGPRKSYRMSSVYNRIQR